MDKSVLIYGLLIATLLLTLAFAAPATADVSAPSLFGNCADGSSVDIYTIKNKKGIVAKVMTLGATLVELHVPDKEGKPANVVLGFDSVADYQSDKNQYFGCTTGRVASRTPRSAAVFSAARTHGWPSIPTMSVKSSYEQMSSVDTRSVPTCSHTWGSRPPGRVLGV